MDDAERTELLQQLAAAEMVANEAEAVAERAIKLTTQAREKIAAVERRLEKSAGAAAHGGE